MTKRGSLLIVGTGFKAGGQFTYEATSAIEHADRVFYGESNDLIVSQIRALNPRAETLADLYAKKKSRTITYAQMTERMVNAVREGANVCVVLYGHPGIFARPGHRAIQALRAEGYEAQMLPGVSAEDCLFADLNIDPGDYGCQSYEATDFLIYRRVFDRRSTLVLWQVGGIGVADLPDRRPSDRVGAKLLTEVLLETYPPEHEAIIYEAAQFALFLPRMERVPIRRLDEADLTMTSTLVIPTNPAWHRDTLDMERVRRLGLEDYLRTRALG